MSDFVRHIREFSNSIDKNKLSNINNEEETKSDLILPVLNILGYQVFISSEVEKEKGVQIGTRPHKIDYVINKNENQIFIVECKHHEQTDLTRHRNQLYSYFTALPSVHFALLTNGIEYHFHTNIIGAKNVMDREPFLSFDIRFIKDSELDFFKNFCKHEFDLEKCIELSENCKYYNGILDHLTKQLHEPDKVFIDYLTKLVFDGRRGNIIRSRLDKLAKKALHDFKEKTLSFGNEEEDEIVTTRTELAGYRKVMEILKNTVNLDKVVDRDTVPFFCILFDDNEKKPLCNLHFNNESDLKFGIFDKDRNEKIHNIEAVNDIYKFNQQLIELTNYYKDSTSIGPDRITYNAGGYYVGDVREVDGRKMRHGQGEFFHERGHIFSGLWEINKIKDGSLTDPTGRKIFVFNNFKKQPYSE